MARAHYYKVIQDAEGDLVEGLSVRVCDPGTTTTLTDTLYDSDAGITTLANPFTAQGVIDFYLDVPQQVMVEVTLPDLTVATFDYQPVGSVAPLVLVDANDGRWEITVGIDGALTTTLLP